MEHWLLGEVHRGLIGWIKQVGPAHGGRKILSPGHVAAVPLSQLSLRHLKTLRYSAHAPSLVPGSSLWVQGPKLRSFAEPWCHRRHILRCMGTPRRIEGLLQAATSPPVHLTVRGLLRSAQLEACMACPCRLEAAAGWLRSHLLLGPADHRQRGRQHWM